jgi:hypothetical protein
VRLLLLLLLLLPALFPMLLPQGVTYQLDLVEEPGTLLPLSHGHSTLRPGTARTAGSTAGQLGLLLLLLLLLLLGSSVHLLVVWPFLQGRAGQGRAA